MVKKELSMIAAGLSLRYGRMMAFASAALLTAKIWIFPKDRFFKPPNLIRTLTVLVIDLSKYLVQNLIKYLLRT